MQVNIFWFRRDLRIEDNAGLYHALKDGIPVLPIFIFDCNILSRITDKADARVTFIYDTLQRLKSELISLGTDIDVRYGNPNEVFEILLKEYSIKAVYTNNDYETYAKNRDKDVKDKLLSQGCGFHSFKDHVIFEKDEVVKPDGKPYTVFTPYKRRWLENLNAESGDSQNSPFLNTYPTKKFFASFMKSEIKSNFPTLTEMGFSRSEIDIPSVSVPSVIIKDYHEKRNFPSVVGTSKLGIHFRFGTISIREKVKKAAFLNQTYLSELIWRDFYAMILYHFPHVEKSAFRPEYNNIQWRNDESEFQAWCQGMTGYPIVDAGMRELSNTGFMHNRVRMITASFLTKHLLIDWRWGEAWFADKLLDFDLASNNGGWQWAAGCGTDAAPYFRIFSPDAQTEKFDKSHDYIKKWVPDLGTSSYPKLIVDHKMARERCLKVYKEGLDRK